MRDTRSLLKPYRKDDTPLGDLARDDSLPDDPAQLVGHLRTTGAPLEAITTATRFLALVLPTSNQPPGTTHQPLTEERKATYLRVLEETGSTDAASAAATPHGTGARPGHTTFRELRKKDPEFAVLAEEAESRYYGALERAMAKWAVTPGERPIVDKNGNVVATETKPPDPRLLLAALRRHKSEWREKQEVQVSGTVDHVHQGGVFSIPFEAALLLTPEKRALLAELVEEVSALEKQTGTLIEHDQRS